MIAKYMRREVNRLVRVRISERLGIILQIGGKDKLQIGRGLLSEMV
jgi:hypothetical protein